MPQREFWTKRIAVEWCATYRCDPLKTDTAGSLLVVVKDQAGVGMELAAAPVFPWTTHEQMVDSLRSTWEGWLFGEPGAMTSALKATTAAYRDQERLRRLGRLA